MSGDSDYTVTVHDPLTVDDLMRAVDLIGAADDELGVDMLEDLQAKAKAGDRWTIGREVTRIVLKVAPRTGRDFLAGLVDVSGEEFGRLPMRATLDVIEQLKAREDIAGFFEQARSLFADMDSRADSRGSEAA